MNYDQTVLYCMCISDSYWFTFEIMNPKDSSSLYTTSSVFNKQQGSYSIYSKVQLDERIASEFSQCGGLPK